MAKIVPQGYANIGAYNEKDRFIELLRTIDSIGQSYTAAQQQQEASDISAMQALYQTIDNYNTPAELDRLNNLRKNIASDNRIFDNEIGNVLNETFDFAISKKRSNYTDVKNQASQLATELMSSNNVLGTPLYELTEADLVRSFTDNIAKEKKEGGYLASIAERRMQAAGFNSLIQNFVGVDGRGNLRTIPSMKIPYTRDDGSTGEMSLAELIKRQARHDEVLQGVFSGAAIDGVISPEQASVIVSLTGEEGFDIDAFIKTGENQRKMFTNELKFRRGSNKDAITKLSSILRTYKEGQINEAAYVKNVKDFANNEDVQSVNPVALTGDPEKDTEEFFKQLQSGNIDKGLFTVMLNDLIEKNDAGIKRAIRGLEAWDVKGIYGNIEPADEDKTPKLPTKDKTPKPSTQDMTSKVDEMKDTMETTIDSFRKDLADDAGSIDISDLDVGGFAVNTEESTENKESKVDKQKNATENKFDSFLSGLNLDSNQLSKNERDYIVSKSSSGFTTNQLLNLVKRYKTEKNPSKRAVIQEYIEQYIK